MTTGDRTDARNPCETACKILSQHLRRLHVPVSEAAASDEEDRNNVRLEDQRRQFDGQGSFVGDGVATLGHLIAALSSAPTGSLARRCSSLRPLLYCWSRLSPFLLRSRYFTCVLFFALPRPVSPFASPCFSFPGCSFVSSRRAVSSLFPHSR